MLYTAYYNIVRSEHIAKQLEAFSIRACYVAELILKRY